MHGFSAGSLGSKTWRAGNRQGSQSGTFVCLLKKLQKQSKSRESVIHELAEGNYGTLPEDSLPEIENSDVPIVQKKLRDTDQSLQELEWIYAATQELREVQSTSFDVKGNL